MLRTWCVPEISAGPARSGLTIQAVEFEPIGSDKNVVHVRIANPTAEQQGFVIDVQTHSRMNWQRPYFTTVEAGETRNVRCVFSFIGPVAQDASIRLRFAESASADSYDGTQYFQQQLFSLTDLPLPPPAALHALPKSDSRALQVRRVFRSFQQLIRQGNYRKIWDTLFSNDYQHAGFMSLDIFENAMTGDLPTSIFYWDRDTLLAMRPLSASSSNDLLDLAVTNGPETWHLHFTPAERGWHIDWITGYTPAILQLPGEDDWERLLLAKTQTCNTPHFEIHYYQDSTAERELSALAQSREQGYAQIVEFLGLSSLPDDRKIRLFLFEDMKTKLLDTRHIGLGFAAGDIIGEVYNSRQQCDPYHEPTHILMSPYGDPPALLNEGIAVYMSERLGGASALRYLGLGEQTLYASVRAFKQQGEWITLQELLTYTDIGSQGSRTVLAYVEAGAFVKYLLETYGKDRFLEAYQKLTNSEDPQICRRNQQALKLIYGLPLQEIDDDWVRSFSSNNPSNWQIEN